MFKLNRVTLALVGLTAASVIGVVAMRDTEVFGKPEAPQAKVNLSAAVATVNGRVLTERQLQPLMMSGLDRANAIDRLINRAVAHGLAVREFDKEAEEAQQAAILETTANLYAVRKSEQLQNALTDDELKKRYDQVVKDADFNSYQINYAVFGDDASAAEARAGAIKGNSDSLKLFKPLAMDGSGKPAMIGRNDVPYGMGVLVGKMAEGEFSEPRVVRTGVIVLQLKKVKTNPKPEFEFLKPALKQAIADERLAEILKDARAKAQVSIK